MATRYNPGGPADAAADPVSVGPVEVQGGGQPTIRNKVYPGVSPPNRVGDNPDERQWVVAGSCGGPRLLVGTVPGARNLRPYKCSSVALGVSKPEPATEEGELVPIRGA